ncbi:DUF498 domain protein [Ophiocordyceps camponoti-floridani]|uniref:DUF498 domain protein n=1 Tax=Ophiocordyceps camponoti-floridani TaxID=2030778 RepID=A0A8H4Q923_9HYPO|nr:DUF498 domain protein [Ophiocordyceps camponoti-floridani]
MRRILTRHLRVTARGPFSLLRPWTSVTHHYQIPRRIHVTPGRILRSDRPSGPPPTDFKAMDVLGNTPAPSTSVDVCMSDGFGLNSGITISGGDGALLVSGEAFVWRPWRVKGVMELVNEKGQFDVPDVAFGLFELLWPRPELLILGVGKYNLPLSPRVKKRLVSLGMRMDVLDTRNAAAQFNLLATERGVTEVAAALIPIGWKEGVGAA